MEIDLTCNIRTRTAAGPLVYVLVLSFLASAVSLSTTVIPRMYLRFQSCPLVLDIELSMSVWYQKTRRVLMRTRRLLLLLLLSAGSHGVRCAVEWKQNNNFVPIRTPENPVARRTHNTPA